MDNQEQQHAETQRQMELQQRQTEALIRLMLAARYVDKKLSLSENDAFQRTIEELTWTRITSLEGFINQSMYQVRNAMLNETSKQQLLEEECGHLARMDDKRSALRKIESVLQMNSLDPTESEFLEQVRTLMGL